MGTPARDVSRDCPNVRGSETEIFDNDPVAMAFTALAISGSLRQGSYNRRLLQNAKRISIEAGAQATELDLKSLDLPIFDQDIQDAGVPESVTQLKAAVEACDALLIASPEYNYSVSSALKNALDWGSRLGNSWQGKTAVIMSVSNGQYGGVRGLLHLRQILVDLDVLVLPKPMIQIRNGPTAFTPAGDLVDTKSMEKLEELIQKTFTITPTFRQLYASDKN